LSQDLQQTRYDNLLRRVGGLIGPGSKVSEVLGELFPVIDVERVPGELLYLFGTKIAMGSVRLAATPGQQDHMQLFNPVDSSVLITLTEVVFSVSIAQRVRWQLQSTALALFTANQAVRDSRKSVIEQPVGQIRHNQPAGGLATFGEAELAAATAFRLNPANSLAVLLPGTGFTIATTTANSDMLSSWFWRERPAEQSELNF